MLLTAADLHELTGYTQHARQVRWLRDRLRLDPPLRPDGSPVVSRAAVEAALSQPRPQERASGPRWSKVPA